MKQAPPDYQTLEDVLGAIPFTRWEVYCESCLVDNQVATFLGVVTRKSDRHPRLRFRKFGRNNTTGSKILLTLTGQESIDCPTCDRTIDVTSKALHRVQKVKPSEPALI